MFPKKCPVGRKQKRTPKKNLEGSVVRECLKYLEDNPNVLYYERRNTGALELQGGGYIKFGSKGAADIWCLLRPPIWALTNFNSIMVSYHIEIECKRRDGKGRQSTDQKDFQAMCDDIGILYILVTSAEELAKKIDKISA